MALTHAAPRADRPHIDRRAIVLLSTLLAGALGLIAMSALFLWPAGEDRQFDLGHVDSFAPGTVTSFRLIDGEPHKLNVITQQGMTREPGFHVVRLEDDGLIALDWRSPHLGWAARWVPDLPATDWLPALQGQPGGYDDGYSYWLMDGTRVFGPAPRNLDRFEVEVTDTGRVIVDLGQRIEGERPAERTQPGVPQATGTPGGTPPAGP